MTTSTGKDRTGNGIGGDTGLTDEFLRRTRDPVLLARAARIFRQARARADAAAAAGEAQ